MSILPPLFTPSCVLDGVGGGEVLKCKCLEGSTECVPVLSRSLALSGLPGSQAAKVAHGPISNGARGQITCRSGSEMSKHSSQPHKLGLPSHKG